MKLYRVHSEFDTYFVVSNDTTDDNLHYHAEEALANEIDHNLPPFTLTSLTLKDILNLPDDWKNAIPWGYDTEGRTIRDLFLTADPEKEITIEEETRNNMFDILNGYLDDAKAPKENIVELIRVTKVLWDCVE